MDEPTSIGAAVKQVANRQVSQPASTHLAVTPLKTTKAEFSKAMAHLCALKRTAGFSDVQIAAWHAALGAFPIHLVNRSVLILAASQERFPEFGDVFQICRQEGYRTGYLKKPYCPTGDAKDTTVTAAEIDTMGEALGLKVKP